MPHRSFVNGFQCHDEEREAQLTSADDDHLVMTERPTLSACYLCGSGVRFDRNKRCEVTIGVPSASRLEMESEQDDGETGYQTDSIDAGPPGTLL